MKTRTVLFIAVFAAAFSALGAQVPERIVMGGRAVTMVADAVYAFPDARARVQAVGGTDQGLGIFLRLVDPAFKETPALQRQSGVEAYAAFRPDLVIVKSAMRSQLGAGLDALGIRSLYLNLESPDDYYKELAELGRVLGDPARGAELVGYYKDLVTRVASATGTAGGVKPRVLVIQSAGEVFQVPPASWIQTRMVELAGGIPVWTGANPGSGWSRVGPEQIAAWNPDVVFVISYKTDVAGIVENFRIDPRYSVLAAVRSGKVWGFPQDFLSWDQPDVRWGLGLLWMTNRLHPGRLAGYSAEAEARRFFRLFYGLDDAVFNQEILTRFKGDWK
ncbi:MAG: ABC transporter substrate-binding protein [Spirochaetia bacterium]|jgi:iron complex transport system substrate-binding protein|nr:ABC transporter substrate-binding protein [Spirochaetia bacterium]